MPQIVVGSAAPGRGSLRPPAASRCSANKLAARSFPRRPPAYELSRRSRVGPATIGQADHAGAELTRPEMTACGRPHGLTRPEMTACGRPHGLTRPEMTAGAQRGLARPEMTAGVRPHKQAGPEMTAGARLHGQDCLSDIYPLALGDRGVAVQGGHPVWEQR
jgi:hypothetical protein